MNSQIPICLAKPFQDVIFGGRVGREVSRNHAQFSMKTISYSLLRFPVPAWGGWLKTSWHRLFLMTSQAQMVGGKTILAVKMFVTLLSIFTPPHRVSTSWRTPLCLPPHLLSPLLADSPPSCSHAELSGTPAPLNDVNASPEPVKGLSELRIPSRSHIEGRNHRFPFRAPCSTSWASMYTSRTPYHPYPHPPPLKQAIHSMD